MKKSPTQLMKELKAYEQEIARVYEQEKQNCLVPVDCEYNARYQSEYNFADTRKVIDDLQNKVRIIRRILNKFNNETKVIGFDLTISEALVELGQLKAEVKAVSALANKNTFNEGDSVNRYSRSSDVFKVAYDIKEAKEWLHDIQGKLATLQVAIDRTNLNSQIDC